MPDFHAEEQSKMFGTSMFDTQPDDKITEFAQRPMQMVGLEVEDDALNEEQTLRQMSQINPPATEPSCPMMKSDGTHSQVTSKVIKSQNKVLPQGQDQTTKMS